MKRLWGYNRIVFLVFAAYLTGTIFASPCHSSPFGTDKKCRICVTTIVSHPALDADQKGFEAALSSSGFKEDVNVIYERHNAQGDLKNADAISKQLLNGDCDLIHSISTPATQSVLKYIKETPVVFSSVTDPEAAGIVSPGSTPGNKTGGHITGVSDKWPVQLQMKTYAKFVPEATNWGTIYNPNEDNSISHVKEMKKAIHDLGLKLIEKHATNAEEVETAAKSLAGRVQAIAITADNTSVAHFDRIAKVCNEHKIALFAGDVDSVPKGAIAAFGTDYFLIGYSAGKKAALILKGIDPGDIPWGVMEKFSFIINRKAASLQGVTIPPALLKKADKLID